MAGRPFPKIEIILKKFGNPKIISTFAIPIAEIAQLVEHDLAIYLCNPNRGNSSVGRARPCQGRGREFESRFPLQL